MGVNLEVIKHKRKLKGFSIDDMAANLCLANGSVYWKRESGHYKFKAEEVLLLSKLLEIPMDDLFLSNNYFKTEILRKGVL